MRSLKNSQEKSLDISFGVYIIDMPNHLKIIQDCGKDKWGQTISLCSCSCGAQKVIHKGRVMRGIIKSCGCLKKRKGKLSPRFKGHEEILGEFWRHIINNAKKRNIEFSITIQAIWELYLTQNKKCALSGLPLTFQHSIHGDKGTASLDRINSSKGYTMDNIQWVHKDINWMKQDFDESYFLNLCKIITKHKPG